MMATLWKRATPPQYRMLRAIAGAVENAAHAHQAELPRGFARSVAKRATGTLTAQWPDVLAAKKVRRQIASRGHLTTPERRRSDLAQGRAKGDRPDLRGRSPLRKLWKDISRGLWRIKRTEGEEQRYQAYIEILQMIDRAASKEEAAALTPHVRTLGESQ